MTTNPAASQYHEYAEGLVLHYTLHEPSEPIGTVIFIHGSGPGASGWSKRFGWRVNIQTLTRLKEAKGQRNDIIQTKHRKGQPASHATETRAPSQT